jgi:hypothetical protein
VVTAVITRPRKYTFRGQRDGVYYWASPVPGTVTEEIITCSVRWFWDRNTLRRER